MLKRMLKVLMLKFLEKNVILSREWAGVLRMSFIVVYKICQTSLTFPRELVRDEWCLETSVYSLHHQ